MITFYNTCHNGFVWDDERNIVNNRYLRDFSVKNLKNILLFSYDGSIQPVKSLSYFIQYHFWALNPLPYHIWNIMLYILNIILIYFLIRHIAGSSEISLITCLLFSVHPLHSEIVAALFGKEYIYAFIFFLSSLLLFIKYLNNQEQKILYILSVISYLMSIMSKEFALTLFPLFILYDFSFVTTPGFKHFYRRFKLYIPFILSSLLFLYILMTSTERVKSVSGLSPMFNFLMDLEIFTVFYIKKLLYPVRLNPMYNIKGLYLTYMIMSLSIFLLIFLSLIISWKKSKSVFYFTMWFLTGLAAHSHFIIAVTFVAADRYIYFSSLAFCFFLSLLIVHIFRKGRKFLSISLMIVIMAIYINITVSQNRKWENNIILWTYVTSFEDDYKDNCLAFTYLANAYLQNRDIDKAIECYEKALNYSKDNYRLKLKLGLAYLEKGDYDRAASNLEEAKKLGKTEVYNNLAIAYFKKGLKDKAVETYRKSLEIDPEQVDIKKNLNILLK